MLCNDASEHPDYLNTYQAVDATRTHKKDRDHYGLSPKA